MNSVGCSYKEIFELKYHKRTLQTDGIILPVMSLCVLLLLNGCKSHVVLVQVMQLSCVWIHKHVRIFIYYSDTQFSRELHCVFPCGWAKSKRWFGKTCTVTYGSARHMKPVFLVSFVLEELLRLIPAEVPQLNRIFSSCWKGSYDGGKCQACQASVKEPAVVLWMARNMLCNFAKASGCIYMLFFFNECVLYWISCSKY